MSPTNTAERETLLVATHGGHVSELVGLAERIADVGDHLWITNRHPQTERLLAGEPVRFVPFIETRDVLGVLRALPDAVRTMRTRRFGRVVSTGSAIALAYLPVAAAFRIPAHYIESATRVEAPSLTGRILRWVPGVTTWWQHDDPPTRWRTLPGLYSHFRREEAERADADGRDLPVRRLVVTVGTTDYSFRRLVERLVQIVPAEVEVFWQVGATDVAGLGIDGHPIVDADMLRREIDVADAVVTHAGAGSLLQSLEAGHIPVYVPRRQVHGEQVDDHQVELAQWAERAGLAVCAEADEIDWDIIVASARLRSCATTPRPIELERR